MCRLRSSQASFIASISRWWRSAESGAWRDRPICDTMLSAISAVSPCPDGGISRISRPMKGVDRLHPVRPVGREVIHGEKRALGPHRGDDLFPDLARVKGIAAVAGDQLHGAGKRRVGHRLAHAAACARPSGNARRPPRRPRAMACPPASRRPRGGLPARPVPPGRMAGFSASPRSIVPCCFSSWSQPSMAPGTVMAWIERIGIEVSPEAEPLRRRAASPRGRWR